MNALDGIQVVDLSVNVPGPAASARLHDLGAHVTKIEPPTGDPLRAHSRSWYEELRAGKFVETLDLKTPAGLARLDRLLDTADLLLTSSRSRVLDRFGLNWSALHPRFPRLCHVAIVGHRSPRADEPGHDLTYQGAQGLLVIPADRDQQASLPRSLAADLHGAERAVSVALTLLFLRERNGEGSFSEVALADAAGALAASYRHGLTQPGGLLGGGYAPYNLYACADGWIAIAALEPAFWARFIEAVERPDWANAAALAPREVADLFRTRTTDAWLEVAARWDLPIARPTGQALASASSSTPK